MVYAPRPARTPPAGAPEIWMDNETPAHGRRNVLVWQDLTFHQCSMTDAIKRMDFRFRGHVGCGIRVVSR